MNPSASWTPTFNSRSSDPANVHPPSAPCASTAQRPFLCPGTTRRRCSARHAANAAGPSDRRRASRTCIAISAMLRSVLRATSCPRPSGYWDRALSPGSSPSPTSRFASSCLPSACNALSTAVLNAPWMTEWPQRTSSSLETFSWRAYDHLDDSTRPVAGSTSGTRTWRWNGLAASSCRCLTCPTMTASSTANPNSSASSAMASPICARVGTSLGDILKCRIAWRRRQARESCTMSCSACSEPWMRVMRSFASPRRTWSAVAFAPLDAGRRELLIITAQRRALSRSSAACWPEQALQVGMQGLDRLTCLAHLMQQRVAVGLLAAFGQGVGVEHGLVQVGADAAVQVAP